MTPIATRTPSATLPLLLLCALLAGCAPSPRAPDTTPVTPAPAVDPERPGPGVVLELPPSQWETEFRRAAELLEQGNWMAAEQQLARPQPPLGHDDAVRRNYLLARSAYLRGDQAAARELLERRPRAPTHVALRRQLDDFVRHMDRLAGDYLASAERGIGQWEDTDHPALRAALKRDIWLDLQQLSPAELQQAEELSNDPQTRGWLSLASIAATPSLSELRTGLKQWLRQHPDHPAAAPLPGGLDYLLREGQPLRKVALLLPLSGRLAPAARAVRDGYLAHYYAARARGDADHELRIIDSGQFADAGAAYQRAVAEGAELVVGPLSKEAVTLIGRQSGRPVPTLALNRVDETLSQEGSALVQMALAPEDEVLHLAELAFGQGARRALILRPAGERGGRLDEVLRRRWRELGGAVSASATYSSPEAWSDSLKTALNLTASEQRAREVRSMLATNIEFSPRRRHDIDAVFMLAGSPEEARSLKPLLAFHYAGKLPVYATSSSYSGIPDARDRDLNGTYLTDLPWLLGANPELRVALAAGDTGSDSFTRLNALGADAWLLQSRFAQLQAGGAALLRGSTGLLQVDDELRIIRQPALAVFDGGVLTRP
ncbi:penicillin-binding protein activator [Kineobactrum salinum]|uniref:Penicillin-binding protein activator n=1 Tax=Kineobactrum salinum TaxID=2708301 RepID=A0A6C0U804_9GAMM|nr:penicillin-binding protein activator [Kineobactrum salinum]QIB66605.1 penicillin-binding protein activator [Kineobactrum salinum]